MSTTNNSNTSRALPQVRLIREGDHALVAPPTLAGIVSPHVFEPFPLPKIQLSKLSWAGTFCEIAWQQHRRCVGIVLLLKTRTRRWGFGFPAQRCSKTAACWSVYRADFPDVDEAVHVGGSFQSRVLSRGEDAEDAVAPVDGLHVVMAFHRNERHVRTFVRAEDQVRRIPPDDVSIDDWLAKFQECQGRLKFL